MIPLSIEQSQARHPDFQVLIAWGGDLALASGLMNPVVATASSSATDHPAADVNNGDRTLINNSWWESTNSSGQSFSPTTSGYVFRDLLTNLTQWTVEYTTGSVSTHTSVADSPYLDMTLSSGSLGTLGELFRRCTTNVPFNSASRMFSFMLKQPNTRHHISSGTDIDQVYAILCPTVVTATSPRNEADAIRIFLNARENYCEFGAIKRISGVATNLSCID